MRHAFSLVELSIVLVILGLLTGGILGGQSLIRAAELRAVSTEFQRYVTASHTFRDKYFGLPGDITNATLIWGAAHGTPATCRTTASTGAATCDGNGDGNINTIDSGTTYSERHRYWQQLSAAGLIEGSYTGVGGSVGVAQVVPGTNAPRSKLGQAGWSMNSMGTVTTVGTLYPDSYGNAFTFGIAAGSAATDGPVLKPEEMWNIDTKLDDGKPAFGTVKAFSATSRPNCSNSDIAASAEYALTNTGTTCPAIFKSGF